jgi:hypothetical protein
LELPSHVFLHQNRPPNPRCKATVSELIGENTGEQRSTEFPDKLLI